MLFEKTFLKVSCSTPGISDDFSLRISIFRTAVSTIQSGSVGGSYEIDSTCCRVAA